MMQSPHRYFLAALMLLAAGCSSEQPQSNLPTVKMQLGNTEFTLEVAADAMSRERGLMRRDSMPATHGMIFVFNEPRKLSFWMRDTRIPLDIVYVDANGKVDSVKQLQPYVRTAVYSDGDVKWAIELNQGAAAKAGVSAGQTLQIPAEAQSPKD